MNFTLKDIPGAVVEKKKEGKHDGHNNDSKCWCYDCRIADDEEEFTNNWLYNQAIDAQASVKFTFSREKLIKVVNTANGESIKCPICDDTGCWASRNEDGDPEPNQCEHCYTVPNSIFNRNLLLDAIIEHAKDIVEICPARKNQ